MTVPDVGILQAWLEMMIRKVKNNGILKVNDPEYIRYEARVKRLIDNEISGQRVSFVPDILYSYHYGLN